MPDAPKKYYLINPAQVEAAKKYWQHVSDKTWVLVLKRDDEPMVLNRAPHRGVGLARVDVPPIEQTKEGMYYRRDMDVLILISGETALAK